MEIKDLKIGEIYHFKYSTWDMLCRYENEGLLSGIYQFKVFSATKESRWSPDKILNLNTSLVNNNLKTL